MPIVKKDRYVRGTHLSVSDDSGQKYLRRDMRLTWDNRLVGADEWEPKHPQLIIRPREDRPAIKDQTRTQDAPTALLDSPFVPGTNITHANVLDVDGNAFLVSNSVLDSLSGSFNVVATVLNSSETSFTIFS